MSATKTPSVSISFPFLSLMTATERSLARLKKLLSVLQKFNHDLHFRYVIVRLKTIALSFSPSIFSVIDILLSLVIATRSQH